MTTKLNETKTNQPVKKLVKLIRNELLLKLNWLNIITAKGLMFLKQINKVTRI